MIREKLHQSIGGRKSCAVVGNGRSVSNLPIDEAYVMRCNRFKANITTDLIISSLYNKVNDLLPVPVLGVLPISETMYQPYTEANKQHLIWSKNAQTLKDKGNYVWTYDENDKYSEVFNEVVSEINAFPTTGMMGIATARWMGFEEIIITGFTFFQEKGDKKPSAHHNPLEEMRLIRKWVARGDVMYYIDELTDYLLWNL